MVTVFAVECLSFVHCRMAECERNIPKESQHHVWVNMVEEE
jgi:hypothetical protein